jgi:hypothetical protein
MQVRVGGGVYPMVAFLDEYSRFIVHHDILLSMNGLSVSTAAQKAIETLPKGSDGKPAVPPEIRSDNGSCYVSKEFRIVLTENGLGHHRIHPHCPEENGLMERANRTLREGLEGKKSPATCWRRRRRWAGSCGVTTRRACTAHWGICHPWSTTGATRRRGSRSGVGSYPRPGITAGSGTWTCGREPCHSKEGRPLLLADPGLCHYG